MALDTIDKAIASFDAARRNSFQKDITISSVGNYWSLWTRTGQPPPGAAPGAVAGVIPTKNTDGALRYPDPLVGSSYLERLSFVYGAVRGQMQLYDRLLHTDGLVANSTAVQNVNTIAFDRGDLNGTDVELWLEIYTALGNTSSTLTINYTDPGGTARVTTFTLPASSAGVGRTYRIPTYDGKWKGFKSVQSVQWSVSTGGAGNFGLTFSRPVLSMPTGGSNNDGQLRNPFEAGLPKLDAGACLALRALGRSTGTAHLFGSIFIGDESTPSPGIEDMDRLVEVLAAAEHYFFKVRDNWVTTSNHIFSLWQAMAIPGAPGNPPSGVGEACSRTTQGALGMPSPVAGKLARLLELSAGASGGGVLMLYDRLVHTSGLVGNVATLQNVNTVALPRYTTGEDVEIFGEVYTVLGGTSVAWTVNYTDETGTARSAVTTTNPGGTPQPGRLIPFSNFQNHHGCRSVQSVQLSATTGAAGNWGITLARRLAEIDLSPLTYGMSTRNAIDLLMPMIEDSACLFFVLLVSGTTIGQLGGDYVIGLAPD